MAGWSAWRDHSKNDPRYRGSGSCIIFLYPVDESYFVCGAVAEVDDILQESRRAQTAGVLGRIADWAAASIDTGGEFHCCEP